MAASSSSSSRKRKTRTSTKRAPRSTPTKTTKKKKTPNVSPVLLRFLITVYMGITILISFVLAFCAQMIVLVTCGLFVSRPTRLIMLGTAFRAFAGKFTLLVSPFWHLTKVGDWQPWHTARNAALHRAAKTSGVIYCMNHRSNTDPFLSSAALWPAESKYISKASLFNLPFGGWAMTISGDLPIHFTKDKGGWGVKKGTIGKMMNQVKQYLRDGIDVMVFPEGARSRTGDMGDFKLGMFMTAVDVGAPIVPLAIAGSEKLWRPGYALFDFGSVYIKHGTPIMPGKDPKVLMEKVRKAIVKMKDELDAEYA